MFHFCDCFTLFVLIAFGLDEITAYDVNNEHQHFIKLGTERKSSKTSKNEDVMISAYPHFESKSILPSQNPEHEKVCWKKCNGTNIKNMREILLRKQNDLLRLKESSKSQTKTRKSCGESGCESESSAIQPVQPSQELESGKKNTKPKEFTKIFMSKARQSESGNISTIQYLFARNMTL